MYLILRITLKLNNDNGIESMGHTLYSKNEDLWCACKLMERGVEESLFIGYYNKVVQKTTTSITLSNGNNAYERYCIVEG